MLSVEEVRQRFADVSDRLGELTQNEKALLEFNADLVQQYADLEAEMHSRLEDVTMLHNISRSLMSILDPDALLRNIVDSVKDRLSVESCSLLLLDEQRSFLQIQAASGKRFDEKMIRETRIPIGQGISGTVAQTGEPILVSDIESDPRWGRSNRSGYSSRSLLCVPMKVQDEVIGVLNVNEKLNETPFDEYDLKILSILAANASAALASARFIREIRNKESLISNITQSVPSGLLAIGLEGEVLLINRALRRFMRIENPSPIGKPYASVLGSGVIGLLEPIMNRAWETGSISPETIELARDDGFLPIEISGVLLRNEQGTITGILLGFRDISESREIDKLRRLDQMKSNFVSVASHELRTPLTSMIASLSLLNSSGEVGMSESQRSLVRILYRNSKRLLDLVNDILDLSRLESETITLRTRSVRVGSMLQHVYDSMNQAAEAKSVQVEIHVSDCLDFVLDEEKFEQVLLNLLSNAIKFTPEEGRIVISAEKAESGLQIWVADTGTGIPDEDKERIFDKFYQVEDAQSRTSQGTGLGLAICRKLVELHNGRIWVESELGKGSTFVIFVPCPDIVELVTSDFEQDA